MNKLIIISRYAEDVSWIKDYNIDYLVFNKGTSLTGYKQQICENIGNNQRDIFQFIYDNYDNLPEYMIFVQGNPFEHCNKEVFNSLIEKEELTCLESFDNSINSHAARYNNGYEEINDSWYVSSHNHSHNQTCKWVSLDHFMFSTFSDYVPKKWIRFTPGSQYVIPKNVALSYSRSFWQHLMNILDRNNMTEGHIIERALFMILKNEFTPLIK